MKFLEGPRESHPWWHWWPPLWPLWLGRHIRPARGWIMGDTVKPPNSRKD